MSEEEENVKGNVKVTVRWKVDFEMEETVPVTEETPTKLQREITHTIGRAIGSIASQCGPSIKVTDWHTWREGVEQPEATSIDIKKQQWKDIMKDI